jgi:hypothetical protein
MAFENISDIWNARVNPINYFIDAHIWIFYLDSFNPKYKRYEKKYIEFFNSIIEYNISPRPKIIMCSLLLSEIINTYIKNIALKEYIEENYSGVLPPEFNFKRNYRDTTHFKKHFLKVCDDIKGLNKFIWLVDDNFNTLHPYQILKNIPENIDFNDFYYYSLCKEIGRTNSVSIVTHDPDFKFQDINIITGSRTLKDLKN